LPPMTNHKIIAQRTYELGESNFTIGFCQPRLEDDNWFCDVFTQGLEHNEFLSVGGIDQLQAIRLAISVIDSIIQAHPGAHSSGIEGVF